LPIHRDQEGGKIPDLMMFLGRVKGLGGEIFNTVFCSRYVLIWLRQISNDNSQEFAPQLVDKSHVAESWARVVKFVKDSCRIF